MFPSRTPTVRVSSLRSTYVAGLSRNMNPSVSSSSYPSSSSAPSSPIMSWNSHGYGYGYGYSVSSPTTFASSFSTSSSSSSSSRASSDGGSSDGGPAAPPSSAINRRQSTLQVGGADDAHLPTHEARAHRHIEQMHAAERGHAAEQRMRGEPVTVPKRGTEAIIHGKLRQVKGRVTGDAEEELHGKVSNRVGKADNGIVF